MLIAVGSVALVVAAYRFRGWGGVALVTGGMVMWLLLRFNRMMRILGQAANQPVGQVDSAVMLNARLQRGMTLLQVVTLTGALGAMQSPKNTQPEIFRWADAGQAQVTAEFRGGRLVQWALFRPADPEPADGVGAP